MEYKILDRAPSWGKITPNLKDYEETCANFSWETILAELDGLPAGHGLNIAYEAVVRHANGDRKDHLALRWLGKKGSQIDFSYAELNQQTNRFGNVLDHLGIVKGDCVAVLNGRTPTTYIAALGTLKQRAVFCPLFSAFGPEPIFQRLHKGEARVLVTTQQQYTKKIAHQREALPALEFILLADSPDHKGENVLSLPRLMMAASENFRIKPTDPEAPAILHFTSGTTGMPKGAIHVHYAVLTHFMTAKYALDLHPNDIFWCTADPGWVTGTSYGIIAPFVHGVTNIVDEAEFNAERWYQNLEDHRISVWYTAPTAIRRLMRLNIKPLEAYDLSQLRFVASVGEPLNPEAVVWGRETLNHTIHDNWWQTETGGIMIANFASQEVKPGSMGRPLPGITAAIVRRQEDGKVTVVTEPGIDGDLALRPGWPSMFRGYLHDEERYQKCFLDGWYITGDLAMKDQDGYFWFVGRADDIIKTAGHMVGPFEVESALMEHPAVAEAGVIGKPNPMIGELVKAFVSLNPGFEANEKLKLELLGFGRKKLGSAVAPKEIEFQQHLPKTRSGKIMRRLLKARELGLPEGDISTLEND